MNSVQDYINAFKEKSIKITPQRIALFNVLVGNTSHPTAEDLYTEIIKIHPSTSFATVYNTLDKLNEIGLLIKLNIEEGKNHYDPDIKDHHHFFCKKCFHIYDIFEDYDILHSENLSSNFKVTSYQINLYGTCKTCN